MATVAAPARAGGQASTGYQVLLVGLLGVNIGIVFLDRTAFGLLAPMIQPEFQLDNTQIGLITGALAIGWALSSFALPRTADATGRAKWLLVVATIVFSLASISSGLAIGFLTMVAARLLMGLAEGGLPPLTFAIVTSEVPPERRGLAVGLTSTIGLQAIPLLGPLTIVGIASLYGWREAFWLSGIPGLIMAAAIWLWIRNPPRVKAENAPKGSIGPLLKLRNIRFAMALAALNMTCYASLLGFGPLWLVNVAGMSDAMMATTITGVGVIGVLFAFIGPMLSDRYGRKPAIFGCYAVSIVGALMMALANGSVPLVFAGCLLTGAGGAGASQGHRDGLQCCGRRVARRRLDAGRRRLGGGRAWARHPAMGAACSRCAVLPAHVRADRNRAEGDRAPRSALMSDEKDCQRQEPLPLPPVYRVPDDVTVLWL